MMDFNKQIIQKPWGREILWAVTETGQGKIMIINGGTKTSLHYYNTKDQSFYVYSGQLRLFLDNYENFEKDESEVNKTVAMRTGDCWRVKPRMLHRIEAITNCIIFEMSTPKVIEEKDIMRLDDDYGREDI